MNPHGVQRLYDLALEEVERQYVRQVGRAHEVGLARRRSGAAIAEARLPLIAAAGGAPARSTSGVPLPALVRQLGLRLVRPQVRKTAA